MQCDSSTFKLLRIGIEQGDEPCSGVDVVNSARDTSM